MQGALRRRDYRRGTWKFESALLTIRAWAYDNNAVNAPLSSADDLYRRSFFCGIVTSQDTQRKILTTYKRKQFDSKVKKSRLR